MVRQIQPGKDTNQDKKHPGQHRAGTDQLVSLLLQRGGCRNRGHDAGANLAVFAGGANLVHFHHRRALSHQSSRITIIQAPVIGGYSTGNRRTWTCRNFRRYRTWAGNNFSRCRTWACRNFRSCPCCPGLFPHAGRLAGQGRLVHTKIGALYDTAVRRNLYALPEQQQIPRHQIRTKNLLFLSVPDDRCLGRRQFFQRRQRLIRLPFLEHVNADHAHHKDEHDGPVPGLA